MGSSLLKNVRSGGRAAGIISGDGHHGTTAPYRLVEEIIARSVAGTWDHAKQEWALAEVCFTEEPGSCLCGHSPIRELCFLRNRLNGNEAVVGNVCVRRFLGLPSEAIFASLRRVARDSKKVLSAATVQWAFSRGWLTDWERRFCLDTCLAQKLSPNQRVKRAEINQKVLGRATRQAVAGEGLRRA
jgi:hypothetical protein